MPSFNGVGVSAYNKKGMLVSNLVGTSFSAPLFARRLAEIDSRYGYEKIKNTETLEAIAVVSCNKINSVCTGFGESKSFIGCDRNHALYVTEGQIPLSYRRPAHHIHHIVEYQTS